MATLAPGDSFGESSCVLREPRCASLVATAPCSLLVLSRPALKATVADAPSLAMRLRFMRALQLPLPPRYAHALRLVHVRRGGVVAGLGQPHERLAFVWSGALSLRAVRQAAAAGNGGGAQGSARARIGGPADGAAMEEISIVCAGGCIGDELLLFEGAAGTSPPTSARRSARERLRVPCPNVAASYHAVAREDTALLVLAKSELERLPRPLLGLFARSAKRRREHHEGMATRLQQQQQPMDAARMLKDLACASADAAEHRTLSSERAGAASASAAAPKSAVASTRAGSPSRAGTTEEAAGTQPERPITAPARGAIVGGPLVGMSYASAGSAAAGASSGSLTGSAPTLGTGSSLAPRAKQRAEQPSLEKLLMPARLLTYGRKAATDPVEMKRLADEHTRERRDMPHVMARRRPASLAPAEAPTTQSSLARTPKVRSLGDTSHAAIVEDIRPLPPEARIMTMRKEAHDMAVHAAKGAFTPPAHSASTFVQLRRLAVERNFSSDKFKVDKQFLRPSASAPVLAPAAVHRPFHARRQPGGGTVATSVDSHKSTDWVHF
jgi:CRP-like cAMP-binding protein